MLKSSDWSTNKTDKLFLHLKIERENKVSAQLFKSEEYIKKLELYFHEAFSICFRLALEMVKKKIESNFKLQ